MVVCRFVHVSTMNPSYAVTCTFILLFVFLLFHMCFFCSMIQKHKENGKARALQLSYSMYELAYLYRDEQKEQKLTSIFVFINRLGFFTLNDFSKSVWFWSNTSIVNVLHNINGNLLYLFDSSSCIVNSFLLSI